MNSKSGFIRKVLLIAIVTWIFAKYVLAEGLFIQSHNLRIVGLVLIVAIAIGGVVTLISQRMDQ